MLKICFRGGSGHTDKTDFCLTVTQTMALNDKMSLSNINTCRSTVENPLLECYPC